MNNDISMIYDHIADEESKKVFDARISYRRTGEVSSLNEIITDYLDSVKTDERLTAFRKSISGISDIIIFGAGCYGQKLKHFLPEVKWKRFIDNNPKEKEIMGLQVNCTSDFYRDYNQEYIAIPSKAYFTEMKKELLLHDIPEDNIIDATVIYDITEGRQYFDLEDLSRCESEIFVDGGCYDGTSTFRFAEWCDGREYKSYCFEPDSINCKKIKKFLSGNGIHNYELISKGLWDKTSKLSFVKRGSASSYVANDCDEEESEIIEVTSIDEAIGNIPITFIKMDIEGSELKALRGAKNVINMYHPKLAICVYHKPEDILEIPLYVLSICPSYRLFFRHYSADCTETVMYAV